MSDKPKIGAGSLGAMARQGLAELRSVFYGDSRNAQPVEYGMWGTPTPGEVASDRKAETSLEADQEAVVELTPSGSKLAAKQKDLRAQLSESPEQGRERGPEDER